MTRHDIVILEHLLRTSLQISLLYTKPTRYMALLSKYTHPSVRRACSPTRTVWHTIVNHDDRWMSRGFALVIYRHRCMRQLNQYVSVKHCFC